MSEERRTTSEGKQPKVTALARAICYFPDGESRTLYARSFSLAEVFVTTLRPPLLGTELEVMLCPRGMNPLPPLPARVTSAQLDPRDAGGSGFGAVWVEPDEAGRNALFAALKAFGLCRGKQGVHRPRERRLAPRVAVCQGGIVSLAGASLHVAIANLSMTGALLVGEGAPPQGLHPGTQLELRIVPAEGGAALVLAAQVARQEAREQGWRVGVQFRDLDEALAARLEELVLEALTSISDIVYLPDLSR